MVREASHHDKEVGGVKWWRALSDEAQDGLMVVGLFLEAFLLFGLMA